MEVHFHTYAKRTARLRCDSRSTGVLRSRIHWQRRLEVKLAQIFDTSLRTYARLAAT